MENIWKLYIWNKSTLNRWSYLYHIVSLSAHKCEI